MRGSQKGQAVILVLIALSVFLLGGIGVAIDAANLYAHRQMIQSAADSAAQAGIMSIFNKTNTGTNAFGTSAFACTTGTDVRTPCVYARSNGAGASSSDTIDVSFPTSAPGVTLSPTDTPALIKVILTRNMSTGLARFLNPAAMSIRAQATAAIVDVVSPTPILVTHPTKSGALAGNGNPVIRICGGPNRSIQVNSSSSTSISFSGGPSIDLTHAGPADPGNCTTGTGADFGDFGGPAAQPSQITVGSTGHYVQPSSPILDPLAAPVVVEPIAPVTAGTMTALADGQTGCPVAPAKACVLYSPGLYASGIKVKNETAVFKPGLYYISSNDFANDANGEMYMACFAGAAGCLNGVSPDGVTGSGMVVFLTGSGSFNVGSNSNATLVGSDEGSIYKGILFFRDRSAPATSHSLGGGGNLSLKGTIYVTNTLAIMQATPAQFQTLGLQGNSGSNTTIIGMIIASALDLGGNPYITMQLNPNATLHIRQVALVK